MNVEEEDPEDLKRRCEVDAAALHSLAGLVRGSVADGEEASTTGFLLTSGIMSVGVHGESLRAMLRASC